MINYIFRGFCFVKVILVGNKCDMEEERVVSADRGKQLADQLGLHFFETSAKENINVKGNGPDWVGACCLIFLSLHFS